MQYIFVSAIKLALGYLQIGSAKLQVQTQIMHQNLALILRHLCYDKIILMPSTLSSANQYQSKIKRALHNSTAR